MTYLGNESLGRKLSGDDRNKKNLSHQLKKEIYQHGNPPLQGEGYEE